MLRTQQFSAFVCYRKNPVKCNACADARKIESDCFSRNVSISNDPVIRIAVITVISGLTCKRGERVNFALC